MSTKIEYFAEEICGMPLTHYYPTKRACLKAAADWCEEYPEKAMDYRIVKVITTTEGCGGWIRPRKSRRVYHR